MGSWQGIFQNVRTYEWYVGNRAPYARFVVGRTYTHQSEPCCSAQTGQWPEVIFVPVACCCRGRF